jgi:hypothetical protein
VVSTIQLFSRLFTILLLLLDFSSWQIRRKWRSCYCSSK